MWPENVTLGQSTTKVNCSEFQKCSFIALQIHLTPNICQKFIPSTYFALIKFCRCFLFKQHLLSTKNKFRSKEYLFMSIT